MTYELRRLRNGDMEQAWELDRQAFATDPSHRDNFLELVDPERIHGLFAGGRLAAMARVIAFGQFFGGRSVPMGGLSSVAVAPEDRGQGCAQIVVQAALEGMHECGEVISALYPGTTALYRKLGWEIAGAHVQRRIDARALRSLPRPAPGCVRRAGRSDLPGIETLYLRIAAETNGFLDRDQHRWLLVERKLDDHYIYLALDPAGELDGYVIYSQQPAMPGELRYSIRVCELVAASRSALSALHWTLGSASTQADAIVYPCSPENPLLLLLDEQQEKSHAEIRWMLRLNDLPRAIAARGFPASVRGVARFGVIETKREEGSRLPSNSGIWRLEVGDGRGVLEREGDLGSGADAPRFGMGGLASLYSGWATTATLRHTGLCECGDSRDSSNSSDLALLDAAFAGPTPWMPEEF